MCDHAEPPTKPGASPGVPPTQPGIATGVSGSVLLPEMSLRLNEAGIPFAHVDFVPLHASVSHVQQASYRVRV